METVALLLFSRSGREEETTSLLIVCQLMDLWTLWEKTGTDRGQ